MNELTDDLTDKRLSDHPNSDTVTIATTQWANEAVITTDMSSLAFGTDIEQAAKIERTEKKLKKQDILFVAIAWSALPIFRFFKLYPEVVFCDDNFPLEQ